MVDILKYQMEPAIFKFDHRMFDVMKSLGVSVEVLEEYSLLDKLSKAIDYGEWTKPNMAKFAAAVETYGLPLAKLSMSARKKVESLQKWA